MKDLYDLKICIPPGRKPGKYLQKVSRGYNYDIKALVESLNYQIGIVDSQTEILKSLYDCHSCQSKNGPQFSAVIQAIQDIELVVLYLNNDILARSIINPKRCTFAGVYGGHHYILKARLEYAGYTPGKVFGKTLNKVLSEFQIKEPDFKDIPKSKKETIVVRFYWKDWKRWRQEFKQFLLNPDIWLKKNLINDEYRREIFKKYWEYEDSLYCLDITATQFRKRLRNWFLQYLKSQRKRWSKLSRKYKSKIDSAGREYIEYLTVKHRPIKQDYRYQQKTLEYFNESKFFNDDTRVFVKCKYKIKKGWYKSTKSNINNRKGD